MPQILDTVLTAKVGRGKPKAIASWSSDTPELDVLINTAKGAFAKKCFDAGTHVPDFTVTKNKAGPVIPV